MACVSVHPCMLSPLLASMLQLKSGQQTSAAVDDAARYLDTSAQHLAELSHSLHTYAAMTRASLAIHWTPPPIGSAFHMPVRFVDAATGPCCPWNCADAATALRTALGERNTAAAMQCALALVAAGRLYGVRVRRQDTDTCGHAFRGFIKRPLGKRSGVSVSESTSYRTEVLVAVLVADAGGTHDGALVSACVAAVANARSISSYCSPYALAAALVSAATWTLREPDCTAPEPSAPLENAHPDDAALAHLTLSGVADAPTLADVMRRELFPRTLEWRLRTHCELRWQEAFPLYITQ